MKRNLRMIKMLLVIFMWMAASNGFGQKLVEIFSGSYYPYINSDYGQWTTNGHVSYFYWDADNDGVLERLSSGYNYYDDFPENSLRTDVQSNARWDCYYLPEPASAWSAEGGQEGKYYVGLWHNADESIVVSGRTPVSDNKKDYYKNSSAYTGLKCAYYEVTSERDLYLLLGKQQNMFIKLSSVKNGNSYIRTAKAYTKWIYEDGHLKYYSETDDSYTTLPNNEYISIPNGYLYFINGECYYATGFSLSVPGYTMETEDIGIRQKYWCRITSQDDLDILCHAISLSSSSGYKYHNGIIYSGKENYLKSFSSTSGLWWVNIKGCPVKQLNGIGDISLSNAEVHDFNGDGIPDIWEKSGSLYLSNGDNYKLEDVTEPCKLKDVLVIDVNHDGRLDFFGYAEVGSGSLSGLSMNVTVFTNYVPVVYLQKNDGQFFIEYMSLVTDQEELRNAMYNTGTDGAFTSYSTVPGGWVAYAPPRSVEYGEGYKVLDINNDGYSDIIYPNGRAILSLPDGRYYAAEVKGDFSICDLNGDGIKDIVTYDKSASQVLLDLSQQDGTFTHKKLIDNGNISAVFCRDLDGDGLIDIMLQAVTQSYSYIVFFKNNADGTFKKVERYLEGKYYFSKPLDLRNDGFASVLALKEDPSNYYCVDSNLYIINWDKDFILSLSTGTYEGKPLKLDGGRVCYDWDRAILDYDGDGQLDVPVILDRTVYDNNLWGLYTPQGSLNTAPQQMERPSVVYDKNSGTLRISWKDGKDKESASGDLKYSVKAGTAVGMSDLLYYDAGRTSYCVLNVGSWPKGNIYISVCAEDPNGMEGAWSESVSFVNDVTQPDFLLSNLTLSTGDTLTVKPYMDHELTYSVKPDGEFLTNEQGQATIQFATAGIKTITATNAEKVTKERKVKVLPFGVPDIKIQKSLSRSQYFDLNQNGKNEYFGKQLHTYENNQFTLYPSMFNADVSISSSYIMDKNMDGLPDIYGSISKNGSNYKWMVNQGEMDFTLSNDESQMPQEYENPCWVDINNDGFLDYFFRNGGKLYVNKGDYTFEELPVDGIIEDAGDVDMDGNIDLLVHQDHSAMILRNNGNLSFEATYRTWDFYQFVSTDGLGGLAGEYCIFSDVNDDGVLDIMETVDVPYHKPYAVLFDKNFKWKEHIAITRGTPFYLDMEDDKLTCWQTHRYHSNDTLYWKRDDMSGVAVLQCAWGEWNSDYWRGGHPFLADFDNDNKPELCTYEKNVAVVMDTRNKNLPPTAPTSVFVNQTDEEIVINWTGGNDVETPNHRLRYNLSVKEKGANGDNAYIISPLNATKDEAKAVDLGDMRYRYATRFAIPFSRFKAGKTYEIQVQTVDSWCKHSPFSEIVEFTPTAQSLFSIAEKTCVGRAVSFSYSSNIGTSPTIETDGVVTGKTIKWNEPGLKTVTVIDGSLRSEHKVQVLPLPNLTMETPEKMLMGSTCKVHMPEASNRSDGKVTLSMNNGAVVSVEDEYAIIAMPEKQGKYTLTIKYEDPVYGQETVNKTIEAIPFRPEINKVIITDEGCMIEWVTSVTDNAAPFLTGKVKIYRETSVSGDYDVIGEADITDGSFVDMNARPDIKSYRYMITLPTTYGSESMPSNEHSTVLLLANQGLGNDINLHWNSYEGSQVATYTIYAGSSRDNLQVIDEVSGNTLSYVHHRNSNSLTYYAIGYTLTSELADAVPMHHAASAGQVCSNVICSDEAYNVLMVQNISVYEKDGYNELNKERTQLNMQATVTPALATLARVEWSITTGNDLAEVDQSGILTIKSNTTGGTVTVQARSIDGSNITGSMDISVTPYSITGMQTLMSESEVSLRYADHGIYVDNIRQATDVSILSISGSVVYRNRIATDYYIPLAGGIYIVKAGKTVQKVAIK